MNPDLRYVVCSVSNGSMLVSQTLSGTTELVRAAPVDFTISSSSRRCVGYYGRKRRRHVPCPSSRMAERGKQCTRCFFDAGFIGVHQVGRTGELPSDPDERAYVLSPHFLYLAAFGTDVLKVGITSESRGFDRLIEQGAHAAVRIGTFADGIVVRQAEDFVSSNFPFVQTVKKDKKTQIVSAGGSSKQSLEALLPFVEQVADACASFALNVDVVHWESTSPLLDGKFRDLYPLGLVDDSSHRWNIAAQLGPTAQLDFVTGSFVVDVSKLESMTVCPDVDGRWTCPQPKLSLF